MMIDSTSSTVRGRSLRSGRTLPRPSQGGSSGESLSPGGVGSSDEESALEGMEVVWAGDETDSSTASSDISDWTAEAGVNFTAPHRKTSHRKTRKKRRCA